MVLVGLTVTAVPVRLPGCQTYDAAPLAESVVLAPGQTVVLDADAITVGALATLTVWLAVPVQPLVVPLTVYVVVLVGAKFTVAPGKLPGCHVYVLAPDAVSSVLPPVHTALLPLIVSVGIACTLTETCPVDEQVPLLPVTV